ncbi:MAG: NPCBM/NEW2 domain-containing protein [Candidatus Hydrogenedentes bacterium]|nr:NPCBM/NEW2 domain-containing protein [Candidatus Hydrogenedentota bacterium]
MTRKNHGWILACAAALLLATVAGAEEMAANKTGSGVFDLIVSHSQGWGELGNGAAAHAQGSKALPMRIKDTTYEAGLGTHAPSETIVLLGGQYLSFEADAGVQWQGGKTGSVVMQVLVDDKKVFDSGVLKETSAPVPVKVGLEGADELRLVVTDAGDGITCDLANWANTRLTENPAAKAAAPGEEVDLARFAAVRSWDPARIEGSTANRLQPVPADELFPGDTVKPAADGAYPVPTAADGRGCIGIEWLERRRTKRIELESPQGAPAPEPSEVQYWEMGHGGGSPGGSRWQGRWLPLKGEISRDGNRWAMKPDWRGKPEARTGTLKIRWIFPASSVPIRLSRIGAYTYTSWKTADLTLRVENPPAGAQGTVQLYNGAFKGIEGTQVSWKLGEPLKLTVRYAPPRPWQMADRTVLRFSLPSGAFGVAVDDVVDKGPVYVAHAGLLVSTGSQPQDPAAYRQANADKKSILEEVRATPEQTSLQAMEHVYRPDAVLGPTMLSLACDNRKFVVERNGVIAFDNDPAVYDLVEHALMPHPYSCRVAPDYGVSDPKDIKRRLERDWLPIEVTETTRGGVTYRQRTFVAPLDDASKEPGIPVWQRSRALGVVEITAANEGDTTAQASFALAISDTHPADVPNNLRIEGRRAIATKGGELLAVVEAVHGIFALSAKDGALHVESALAGDCEARCAVYIPRWKDAKVEDLPAADATESLALRTVDYWRTVMADGMQIEVPDPLFNNLIPASQAHCMLAARNEGGKTIAPWIASINYGPLESEAHSVLRGMEFTGHEDFARRGLEYFIKRYNKEGYLTTGYTVMGTGWHLWTLGEYYSLTRDKEWLRSVAPEVERVCRWIMAQREETKKLDDRGEKLPEHGLMPPGAMADWEVFSYYFYMNGYYHAGLAAAGAALRDIDWPKAQEIVDNAADYRKEILRAFRWVQSQAPVFALRNGSWVPEYPTHVYSPAPIENLYAGEDFGRSWCYDVELGAHHLIPMGVLPVSAPETAWMMDHMEDVQFLRDGWHYYPAEKTHSDWFNLGGFAKVQPYYARTGEVHALRDDVKPFIRTYFNSALSLLNREDLSLWEHFLNGAYNKTHETGYFLHQTRLMLVQERGEEMWLAPFVTCNWLQDGMRVAVRKAPTFFGPVAYSIVSHVAEGHIDATIEPPTRAVPKAIVVRLRHPEGKMILSAVVTGAKEYAVDAAKECIRITPSGGNIAVRANY